MSARKKFHKPILYYTPRLLSLLLLFILSTLAIGAYREAAMNSFERAPFVIYLFPIFILLLITAISWKRGRIGGTLFIVGGFFYAFMVNDFSGSSLAMVATPLILLGVLFHISQYFYEK